MREFEQRIQATFKPTPVIQQLLTLPGVGLTLAVVIALEVGDVARFATAEKLAELCGDHPARPRERREDPIRSAAPGRQPLPEVGIRRSRERDLSHARARGAPPRQPPL